MRRGDPARIGLFVVAALALLVAAILVVGGGRLFADRGRFVVHFDESLKGLHVGAPVAFRGVDVGEVVDIKAVYRGEEELIDVPVTIELRGDAIVYENGLGPRAEIEALIERGLRAQLQMQSLLTGQLFVALDFFPGESGHVVPAEEGGPVRIPSVPSPWAHLRQSVDDIAMTTPDVLQHVASIAATVDELLQSEGVRRLPSALASLDSLLAQLADPQGAAARTVERLPTLVAELEASAAALKVTLDEGRVALASVAGLADTAGDVLRRQETKLGDALEELRVAATSIDRFAEQWSALAAENRPGLKDFTERGLPELQGLVQDATRMVNELHAMLRDIRQDPARFLFGNPLSEGVRPP